MESPVNLRTVQFCLLVILLASTALMFIGFVYPGCPAATGADLACNMPTYWLNPWLDISSHGLFGSLIALVAIDTVRSLRK